MEPNGRVWLHQRVRCGEMGAERLSVSKPSPLPQRTSSEAILGKGCNVCEVNLARVHCRTPQLHQIYPSFLKIFSKIFKISTKFFPIFLLISFQNFNKYYSKLILFSNFCNTFSTVPQFLIDTLSSFWQNFQILFQRFTQHLDKVTVEICSNFYSG